VVVLGRTGRNFAAGMSGGMAYVLDLQGDFKRRCNLGMVDLETLVDGDEAFVLELIARHRDLTESAWATHILDEWGTIRERFVKVMPRDYKRVLMAEARARAEAREPEFAELVGAAAY
jgi:glutamate synthase domain-containing protein 3